VSIQAVAWALEQNIPTSGMKLVLISLCNHADRHDQICWPSIQTLAREASMSRLSVQRHLKKLETDGYISIFPTYEPSGRQRANQYQILFDREKKP